MRQPARNKATQKQQIANILSMPAPVSGWNAYDSVADMKPTDAIYLDNWYPNQTDCELRGGCIEHATDMTGNGKTLATYNGLTGSSQLFCVTGSGVYNVSSSGAVSSSLAARTDGKHQYLMFGDGTSNYLILCNGVDKPLYYDGTTWTAVDNATSPALTGVTTTNLIAPISFKGRLMFIEKGSLSFWYLGSGVAGGALTEFKLDGVAKRGGYLVAAESWTIDAGDGIDDRLVFITSEGEILVYQGTNPASATDWALVGVYYVGRPIGNRCLFKYAAELFIITKQGVFPITTVLSAGGTDFSRSVTKNIQREFASSAEQYAGNYGWSAIHYPAKSAVLMNIPLAEDGIHHQYVLNTITGAWCRFLGWDAEDFALFNDELYFCKGTSVHKAWAGTSDNGSNIDAYGKTAFNYLRDRGRKKHVKMFRGIFASNGSFDYLIGLDTDFEDNDIIGSTSPISIVGSIWGTATWGTAIWGGSSKSINKDWYTPTAQPGYAFSGKIKVTTNNLSVTWQSIDYVYELGNGI